MPSRTRAAGERFRVAFLGDIVGQPGREAVKEFLHPLREAEDVSLVIGNAENAAGGTGLTPPIIDDLLDLGLDVLTTGNHVWAKKEVMAELDSRPNLVRPANYPEGAPGKGWCLFVKDGVSVAVLNLCGRVFMNPLDCPFQVGDRLITRIRRETPIIFVDMHAEATSEKVAMGWYLDGRVTAVIGTHTHVQTADARIMPKGTAYLTDAGMTGPSESVIGMRKEIILQRFLTQLPQKFEVARHYPQMEGVLVDVDVATGLATAIAPFRFGGSPPLSSQDPPGFK